MSRRITFYFLIFVALSSGSTKGLLDKPSLKDRFLAELFTSSAQTLPTIVTIVVASVIANFLLSKIRPTMASFDLVKTDAIKDTFSSIIGNDEAKESFQEIIEFLKNPKTFTSLGLQKPSGVLLYGNPGNGKTMLARAVAKESHCSFLAVTSGDLEAKWYGEAADKVKGLFNQARKNKPCIIFIDEIDGIGMNRTLRNHPEALIQLLSEMDGFAQNSEIVVIGATNNPAILDPALLRPGRFDRKIEVKNPDFVSRIRLLQYLFSKISLKSAISDMEYQKWSSSIEDFSNADISHIANEIGLYLKRNNRSIITYSDLMAITNKEINTKQNILRSNMGTPISLKN